MAIADLAYQRALDRLSVVGCEALTEKERDLAALWLVEAQVSNGGLVRFYSGAAGDLAFHAPAALARVGAEGKAAIVSAGNELFGPEGPPRDAERRRAVVRAFTPTTLAVIDELERRYFDDPADVDELVERFLDHRE